MEILNKTHFRFMSPNPLPACTLSVSGSVSYAVTLCSVLYIHSTCQAKTFQVIYNLSCGHNGFSVWRLTYPKS